MSASPSPGVTSDVSASTIWRVCAASKPPPPPPPLPPPPSAPAAAAAAASTAAAAGGRPPAPASAIARASSRYVSGVAPDMMRAATLNTRARSAPVPLFSRLVKMRPTCTPAGMLLTRMQYVTLGPTGHGRKPSPEPPKEPS